MTRGGGRGAKDPPVPRQPALHEAAALDQVQRNNAQVEAPMQVRERRQSRRDAELGEDAGGGEPQRVRGLCAVQPQGDDA